MTTSLLRFSEIGILPPVPTDAEAASVFRNAARYYGEQAHRALAGLCIGLGTSMVTAAQHLARVAEIIEQSKGRPQRGEERSALRSAIDGLSPLASRLVSHENLSTYRAELARRLGEPAPATVQSSGQGVELRLEESVKPRYLVRELEPTVWSVPFELECESYTLALRMFEDRKEAHAALFGEERPLVLVDQSTNRVLHSTGDLSGRFLEVPNPGLSTWIPNRVAQSTIQADCEGARTVATSAAERHSKEFEEDEPPARSPDGCTYLGIESPTPRQIRRPKRLPRSARFLCSFEWSWSPMHSRTDCWHLSLDSNRKYWLLWYSTSDLDEPLCTVAAYVPRSRISEGQAAASALLDWYYRSEAARFSPPGEPSRHCLGIIQDRDVSELIGLMLEESRLA